MKQALQVCCECYKYMYNVGYMYIVLKNNINDIVVVVSAVICGGCHPDPVASYPAIPIPRFLQYEIKI